jgi:hypothetical protein
LLVLYSVSPQYPHTCSARQFHRNFINPHHPLSLTTTITKQELSARFIDHNGKFPGLLPISIVAAVVSPNFRLFPEALVANQDHPNLRGLEQRPLLGREVKSHCTRHGLHNTAIYSRSATMRVNLIRIQFSLSSCYGCDSLSGFAASH